MKTAHIALLSAIGLSTVAIAQTSPQTTPDNNTVLENSVTTTTPAPEAADTPQAPTPTVPETDSATDAATPDAATSMTPESAPKPER
jgi:hypothetical protein